MRQGMCWHAGLIAAALILVAGCSVDGGGESPAAAAPATTAPPSVSSAPSSSVATDPVPPAPDHVVVVVFENKDADQVDGSPSAPYLNALAAQGASLTNAHGVFHISQPNYLALFSGSTQGVTDDDCPLTFTGDNLAAQLQAAGKSFVGYSEDLPSAGDTDCNSGEYARRHAPWVDFPALPASVNQPLSAMPIDYAQLPTISFVVPNVCNDMHDCSVATGDAWAQQHLSGYAQWATAHNSLLIVTFDEDDESSGSNHIPTIVAGAAVRPGSTDNASVDHYSMLRTIEDMYRLPPLGQAATAQPLTGIWTGGAQAAPST